MATKRQRIAMAESPPEPQQWQPPVDGYDADFQWQIQHDVAVVASEVKVSLAEAVPGALGHAQVDPPVQQEQLAGDPQQVGTCSQCSQ